ncbi:hypothetical protein SDC9_25110 [bioreactor metagenome]|uniref:Uncharacterized protein n=1 Tax=bioreactor metagenome TaxID=1076179 RepID=A0A644UJX8_9ZZZZ
MNGIESIAAERARQIDVEGWTPGHDDEHKYGEMGKAAVCYALHACAFSLEPGMDDFDGWWPWDTQWWKPSGDPIRNLEKAGALIAAEIDRLRRAAEIEEDATNG